MKKRSLSLTLALILCLGLISGTAWAAESDFIIDSNGILTAYNGPGGDVVIPEGVRYVGFLGTFNGISIDSGYVFAGRKDITSVTFPSSAIYIGKGAFSGCTGLTSITIPNNITRTGTEIFSGCTGLTDVVIPGSIKKVETAAFSGCINLKNVTLGYGIEEIGGDSFRNCTSLTSISIPDTVSTIQGIAFLDCTSLIDVKIPTTTKVEGSAFEGTPWEANQGEWVVTNGTLIAYHGTSTDIVIPDTVKNIGGSWYQGVGGNVSSVTIPGSVVKIDQNAFWHLTGITRIEIPDSVTYIGGRAFAHTGLISVVIPDSVTTIGNAAFEECYKLTDIVIPSSVTEIDPSKGGIPAFDKSPNVTIHGVAGSYAETYAKEHNIPFVADISQKVGGFNDVFETDYYADPVLWAVKENITAGTSSNAFSPNDTCTSAQILTFLWRSQGKPEPTIKNPFTDISENDYFYKAALWASEKGLVSGSMFEGNTLCTRATTMTYLWKLAGSPSTSTVSFSDVPSYADYAQAVAWAVSKGITAGTSDTTFGSDATCTRGQIVTFLYRAYGK